MDNKKIILYKTEDGKVKIEVDLKDETVWLSQKQMAELFNKSIKTINEHIKNIFKEGELEEKRTIRKFQIVQIEGKREVKRMIDFFNLDVVISVGYRVKSQRGTQFRIWATNLLKQHLIEGYTINEKRLKEQNSKLLQLQSTIKILERTVKYQNIELNEAKGLLKVISDYSYALELLDAYDHQNVEINNTTKKEAYILSYEEAKDIIEHMKTEFSTDLFGHEKDESFKSSLATIYQTAFGNDLYPSIEEKAANLLYFIVKNHSFSDGNKRIAAAIFIYFMKRNNILYKNNGEKRITDNTIVAITLMIATSRSNEKDIIVKVLVNLINDDN